MFDWHQEEDVNILKNGPFTAKFLEQPCKRPLDGFSTVWVNYLRAYQKTRQTHERYFWAFVFAVLALIVSFMIWFFSLDVVVRR